MSPQALYIQSIDESNAFLLLKKKWAQPNGGMKLRFVDEGTGRSRLEAECRLPFNVMLGPGRAGIHDLFHAISAVIDSSDSHEEGRAP